MADTTKLKAFWESIKNFFVIMIPSFFSNLGEKVKNMATWKKALIIVAILILTHGAMGLGMYIVGTNTCKPEGSGEVTPGKPKPHTDINKPVDKNSVCGTEIQLSLEKVGETKFKNTGKDKCKTTVAYFDFDYKCPSPLWSIGIGPGFLIGYTTEDKKVYPMIGGTINFQRHWGNLSIGPAVHIYGAIDKSMFAAGADLMFELRF